MSVTVIIKRKWKVDKPEELLSLLTELRSRAKKQPGYISGETLKSLNDPQDFVVISKWETDDDWKTWLNNKERRDVQGEVDSMIGEKTFYDVFE
ncbi:MAG: antibiotic biosynthesis monooxygenase family protein, partial [Thermodesulfobacteriota bacterium]